MGLSFRNSTNGTVQVVIGYTDPRCAEYGGEQWTKRGYYHIAPGQEVVVWAGDARGRLFRFYAEDISGRGPWWWGPFVTNIPHNPFELCWNIGTNPGRDAWMREYRAPDNYHLTLNLVY